VLTNTIALNAAPKVAAPVFDLESIYKKFPRKRGKEAGLKRLKVQIKTEEDFHILGNAMDNFVSEMKRENRPEDKIPYFSSWVSTWREWISVESSEDFSGGKKSQWEPDEIDWVAFEKRHKGYK
jgi:hypothetical protein